MHQFGLSGRAGGRLIAAPDWTLKDRPVGLGRGSAAELEHFKRNAGGSDRSNPH